MITVEVIVTDGENNFNLRGQFNREQGWSNGGTIGIGCEF